MNETIQVKYLITLLGITSEEMIIADVTQELRQLKDRGAFALYCKNNFSRHQFWNGYQKFLILLGEYKELENEAYFMEIYREKIDKLKAQMHMLYLNLVKQRKKIIDCDIKRIPYKIEDITTDELNKIETVFLRLRDAADAPEYVYDTLIKRGIEQFRKEFFDSEKPKEINFNFQYLGAQK
jgi:hypothetical protein